VLDGLYGIGGVALVPPLDMAKASSFKVSVRNTSGNMEACDGGAAKQAGNEDFDCNILGDEI